MPTKMGDEKKKSFGTVAIKIPDTQELNLVVKGGRGSAIKMRSILKRFGIPQNKEDISESELVLLWNFLTRERRGFSVGVIQTRQKNERNPNALVPDEIADDKSECRAGRPTKSKKIQ